MKTCSWSRDRSRSGRWLSRPRLATLGLAACGDDDDEATSASASRAPTSPHPVDGATVAGGLAVSMLADGVTIQQAGEARRRLGHFHVIADDGCAATGAGSRPATRTTCTSAGGRPKDDLPRARPHELCLQVGDGTHLALGVTDTVKVTVGDQDAGRVVRVVRRSTTCSRPIDNSSDDFAVKQAGYENIRRLLSQLGGWHRPGRRREP